MRRFPFVCTLWWTTFVHVTTLTNSFVAGSEDVSKSESDVCDVNDTTQSCNNNDNDSQCGLYLARSLLAASSTKRSHQNYIWGLYAGKDLTSGEVCMGPDLAINLHSFTAHNAINYYDDEDDVDRYNLQQLSASRLLSFVWQPYQAGADEEFPSEEQGDSSIMLPGPGVLSFYDMKKANTDFDIAASYHRITVNEPVGEAYPGRGAITPFHNIIVRANTDISAGSELLIRFQDADADEDDEDVDPEAEMLDATITEEDIVKVDETIAHMLDFFQKYDNEFESSAKLQIYRFLTDDFMKAAVGSAKASKLAELLPSSPDELANVQASGGIASFNRTASATNKALNWLKTNGLCMDNIHVGPSTITNAGRGAFASRKIAKDGLVAPVPLLHIADKKSLRMYRNDDVVPGYQLLMNYVYSFPNSTMAFFPTSLVVNFVNHADEADKINAKMKWSDHPLHHKEWFKVTPRDLVINDEYNRPGLLMELVATRDIEAGEEIFLDYGPEWKAAWETHVDKWNKKLQMGTLEKEVSLKAADLNLALQTEAARTDEEQEEDPYPETAALNAFLVITEDSQGSGTQEDPYIYMEPYSYSAVPNYVNVGVEERIVSKDSAGKSQTPYQYTLTFTDEDDETIYVSNVPHQALVFIDASMTGDQFIENPFRHYIGIPDDIFPQGKWRNLM